MWPGECDGSDCEKAASCPEGQDTTGNYNNSFQSTQSNWHPEQQHSDCSVKWVNSLSHPTATPSPDTASLLLLQLTLLQSVSKGRNNVYFSCDKAPTLSYFWGPKRSLEAVSTDTDQLFEQHCVLGIKMKRWESIKTTVYLLAGNIFLSLRDTTQTALGSWKQELDQRPHSLNDFCMKD